MQQQSNSVSTWSHSAVVCAFAALVVFVATPHGVDVPQLLNSFSEAALMYKQASPLLTLATCVIVVALWIISFVPLTPLELTLGYLFGVGPSYVVVYLGKVLGCSAAFVLGRTVCRDWAHTQLGRHELLQAIALAVSERPFRICVIVRLAYIPIALKNYGLAVLPVRTSDYVGSLIAVEFVMSLVLVTVGSTAKDLGAMLRGQQSRSAWQLGAMAVGGVFLLTLVSYISFVTQRALKQIREQSKAA